MPVLFVSHASKDDAAASALEAWLVRNGFTDIFIDHHSIPGGEAWRLALQRAAGACRVVLCLVTEHWLASKDCLAEFDAGFYMGKRIIPLFRPRGSAPITRASTSCPASGRMAHSISRRTGRPRIA